MSKSTDKNIKVNHIIHKNIKIMCIELDISISDYIDILLKKALNEYDSNKRNKI